MFRNVFKVPLVGFRQFIGLLFWLVVTLALLFTLWLVFHSVYVAVRSAEIRAFVEKSRMKYCIPVMLLGVIEQFVIIMRCSVC